MLLNRQLFARDPLEFTIPNDGVAEVCSPKTPDQWAVLRWELESFVCSGEYQAGMERVLSTFLSYLHQPKQPAVWVSGFFGSGKSHFVRVLQYLWQDVALPDGARARSLVALPPEIVALLRELTTAGKREGGLWSAGGTLSADAHSIRLALLAILFEAAGLPPQYAPARLVAWLKQKGLYEAVEAGVRGRGEALSTELEHMYVSPVLAEAILEAFPALGSSAEEVLTRIANQFPPNSEITEAEMLQAMEEVLTLQSTQKGKWPLALLVLDELQQSIGDDPDRILQVQNIIQACSSRFGSHLLVVATGQAALESTPQLSKLQDRFTVRVTLSDQDVQQVIRQVVLRKAPDQVGQLAAVLDAARGEIDRHLAASRLAARSADAEALVPDYPLLPTRRRFWERLLRAIDRAGVAAQLRTQLRIVHEATRAVAGRPVGTVIPADFLYEQRKSSMLQSGVLLREVHDLISELNDGTADGELSSRLCATIFLIGELPTEGAAATGVRATADTLADLLVEDLPKGSAELRQRIPALLQQLVADGHLMLVDDEYRLQTRESREWERDRRGRYQKIIADETRIAEARASALQQAISEALKGVKLLQGASKTPRKFELHFGLEHPASDTDAVPVWVRDEWTVSEKVVLSDAQAAGTESPVVFVLIPRHEADPIKEALADHLAATETLEARPAHPTTDEGMKARGAMETRQRLAKNALDRLVAAVVEGARVYQGGGSEVNEGALRRSVEKALEASLVRLFPRYAMADDARWATVVKRAAQGASDALSALGYSGNAHDHPVCKEVQAFLGGAGKTGSEVRKRFGGPGYGWQQDAIDGALLALLAEGQIEAFDRAGQPRAAKEITQSQIGVHTFRSATTVVTIDHRLKVRKLAQEMGLPVKGGEEAAAIARVLQTLSELANSLGGQPPLPAHPSRATIDELMAKSGNEQLVAVAQAAGELLGLYQKWQHERKLQDERQPRWAILQRLLARAEDRPIAAKIKPQVEAICAQRSLLADPDPVQPLISELAADLRSALQSARQRLIEAREAEMEALQATPEWKQLSDEQWRTILQQYRLGPIPELQVGTDDELLATLDARPLRTWEDEIISVPARMRQAREHAAKLLEPKAVRVRPRATTLHTAEEVDAYLADLRSEILKHITSGKPVIL